MSLLSWLCLGVPLALAGEPEDDLHENTVGGAASVPATVAPLDPLPVDRPVTGRAYHELSYAAAKALNIDVAFADRCRQAVEMIYARRYKEAKVELDKLTVDYPTAGIGPSGLAVIYQALMAENFDFRYEGQFKAAHAMAVRQIAAGQQQPGNEAVEYFLLAGMHGMMAIHDMRRGEFLAAISGGFDAVRALGEVRRVAPTFIDPELGDGMYLYWRTVVARTSALLPDGADDRAAGKALMRKVELDGVLMGPAATMALTYAYIEERDLPNALARTLYGQEKYPNNVINTMTAGRVLTSMGRLDAAAEMYQRVLRIAPDNQRSHYHLGVVYARQSKLADAEAALLTYLAFPDVIPNYRGQAHYRLGLLYARQDKTAEARASYEAAVAVSKNEAALKALEKLSP